MAISFQKGSGKWHEGILLFTRQLERLIVTGTIFFLVFSCHGIITRRLCYDLLAA